MALSSNTQKKTLSRRDFIKISAIAGISIGLGTSILRRGLPFDGLARVSEAHYLMGTIVNFNILATDKALGEQAIRKTVAEMKRLIALFDFRLPETPLAKLNREGVVRNAPIDLIEITKQALEISRLTKGAFDITVLPLVEAYRSGQIEPSHLLDLVNYHGVNIDGNDIHFATPGMAVTLDGIAKGWIVDGAVGILKGLGFENVLVEAGGDLMASSANVEGEKWQIAINNPRSYQGGEFVTAFSVKNKAVTTSGDYLHSFSSDFSRHHIIDPRTGYSPAELCSATVVAPNAAEADALSTTLMVLGVKDGMDLVQGLPNMEALLITKELAVYRSENFPA